MDKRQILLIDDEPDKCEVFLNALEKLPTMFKYRLASNTHDVIRRIKTLMPDFIFLDMSNPKIKDLVCLEAIKKEKTIQHIPFYVYSSKLDGIIARKATDLGALKIIKRPKNTKPLIKMFTILFYQSMRAEVRNYAPRYNE